MTERSVRARGVLETFLRESGEGSEGARVREIPLGIPGWSFFTVSRPSPAEDVDPGEETRSFVVREEGSVVTGPPEEELAVLLRRVELLEARPDLSPSAVARATLMLAGRAASVVTAEEAVEWRERAEGVDLAGPSLESGETGAQLVFWAREHPGPGKRPLSFLLVRVSVGGGYETRLSIEGKEARFR